MPLLVRLFLCLALLCFGAAHAQMGNGVAGPSGAAGSTGSAGTNGISARLGKLASANFNTTADQAISISATAYQISSIAVTNCSGTFTLAVGGFYNAASKGGTAMVAAAQAYSGISSGTLVFNPTLAVITRQTAATLYLSLTTAAGSAATCDIYVYGNDFS